MFLILIECDGGGPGETLTKKRSDAQVQLCPKEGQIQARRLEGLGSPSLV